MQPNLKKRSALEQAFTNVKSLASFVLKPQQVNIPQIIQVAQNVGTQVGEKVASVPYAIRDTRLNYQKKYGMPVNWNKVAEQEDRTVDFIESKPLVYQNLVGETFFPRPQQTARVSADLLPFFNDITPAQKTDPYLEQLKQQVLNSPNLRPVAKQSLSNIPIIYQKMKAGGAASGMGTQRPLIAISEKYRDPVRYPIRRGEDNYVKQSPGEAIKANEDAIKTIIQHELLHQTPRLIPMKLFHPKNQTIVNDFTKRWGKEYMKRPGALVEEMFADNALPPAYYWHVFKNLNPNSTKQDFLTHLRSWFVNNVNTSNPESQISNSRGQRVQK